MLEQLGRGQLRAVARVPTVTLPEGCPHMPDLPWREGRGGAHGGHAQPVPCSALFCPDATDLARCSFSPHLYIRKVSLQSETTPLAERGCFSSRSSPGSCAGRWRCLVFTCHAVTNLGRHVYLPVTKQIFLPPASARRRHSWLLVADK